MVVHVFFWLLLAIGFVQGALFENKQAACRFRKCCNESSVLNAHRLNKQQAERLQGYFCQAVIPHIEEQLYAHVIERDHTHAMFFRNASAGGDDPFIIAGATRLTFWDDLLNNNIFADSKPRFCMGYNFADRSCLACSSCGDLMAVGRIGASGQGSLIELWDISQGTTCYPSLQRLYGCGEGTIQKLLFSHDSNYLFVGIRSDSASNKGCIKIFSLNGKVTHLVAQLDHDYPAEILELSLDGRFLASLSKRGFRIWDLSGGWEEPKVPLEIIREDSVTQALFFSPCGRYLFSAGFTSLRESYDTIFEVWDLSMFKGFSKITGEDSRRTCVPAGSGGGASAGQALMPLCSIVSGALISRNHSVYAVSPLGHVAFSGEDNSIIIWDFARMDPEPLQVICPGTITDELFYRMSSLHFSPDGSRLICAGNGRKSVIFRLFASLEPLSFNVLLMIASQSPSFKTISSEAWNLLSKQHALV